MTKYIAIASSKGGTGKTTIAINLATALHNIGKNVLLLDGNLSNPNIASYLNLNLDSSLHDVLEGRKAIEEVIHLHPSGLKIIPTTFKVGYNSNKFGAVLLDLFGKSEFVIIDSAPAFSSETIEAIKIAEETIIVTTKEHIIDAYNTIKVTEELGSVVIGIILNKIDRFNKKEIKDIETFLHKKVLAVIPQDKNVTKSIRIKHPLLYVYPRCRVSQVINNLAKLLI